MFEKETMQIRQALEELQDEAGFMPQNLIVFGCSSSEIIGERIGSSTSLEAAEAVMPEIIAWAGKHGLFCAVQCCEHLNRCLVVEAGCAEKYGLEIVNVIPHAGAGGGLAEAAIKLFKAPVTVETLRCQAHGGMDIGNTFIGMHLRRVAVCVRIGVTHIGCATVNCVRTRPALIGGARSKNNYKI